MCKEVAGVERKQEKSNSLYLNITQVEVRSLVLKTSQIKVQKHLLLKVNQSCKVISLPASAALRSGDQQLSHK